MGSWISEFLTRGFWGLSVTGKQTAEVGAEVLHAKCRILNTRNNRCNKQMLYTVWASSCVLYVCCDAFTLLRLPLARDVIHSSAYYAIRDAGSSSRLSLSLSLSPLRYGIPFSFSSLEEDHAFYASFLVAPPSHFVGTTLLFLIIR